MTAAVIAFATEKSPGIGRRTRAIAPLPTIIKRLESGAGRISFAVKSAASETVENVVTGQMCRTSAARRSP